MIAFRLLRQRVPDEQQGLLTISTPVRRRRFGMRARRCWADAGVAGKFELRLVPALDTVDILIGADQAGSYDFAFLDADKENYLGYYARCLGLLRPGGLIAVDNTLWSGKVADSKDQEADIMAFRKFNRTLRDDDRTLLSLAPISTGLTLAGNKGSF